MRISCIRHGVTHDNVGGIFRGLDGGGLTEEQSRELRALVFDASGFDAIYSSPAARCRETAECLGIASFIEDSRLSERDLGVFGGLTVAECQERYSAEFAAIKELDAGFVIPAGESREQHLTRILSWIRDIPESKEEVLAITHGGTIDFLYRLGSAHELHGGSHIFAGPNAAISVFEMSDTDVRVVTHGEKFVDRHDGQGGHVL